MKILSFLLECVVGLVLVFAGVSIVGYLGWGVVFGGFSVERNRPQDSDAFQYYYTAMEESEDYDTFEGLYAGASVAELEGKITSHEQVTAIEELHDSKSEVLRAKQVLEGVS